MGLLLMIMQYLSVAGTKQQDLFFLYYQPFAPMLSMLWLWGVNVRYFEGRGVRYDVCFAAQDQKYLLPAASIFQVRVGDGAAGCSPWLDIAAWLEGFCHLYSACR